MITKFFTKQIIDLFAQFRNRFDRTKSLESVFYKKNRVFKRIFVKKVDTVYDLLTDMYINIVFTDEERMIRKTLIQNKIKTIVILELSGYLYKYNTEYKPFYLMDEVKLVFSYDFSKKISTTHYKYFIAYGKKCFIKQNPHLGKLRDERFFFHTIVYKVVGEGINISKINKAQPFNIFHIL